MSLLNLYYIVQCTKRFRGCLLRREQLLFSEPITNTTIRSPLWSVWVWNNTKSIVLPCFNPRNQKYRTSFHQDAPILHKSNFLCFWVIFSCDHVNVWAPLFQIKPTDMFIEFIAMHWVLIVYNGATCPSWYSDTFLGPIFQYLQHHAQNFHLLSWHFLLCLSPGAIKLN